MINLDSKLKSRDITLLKKVPMVKIMVFPVVMYGCEWWVVVLEKTLEISLDYKEIKPVNPKGNQSWIFIGRIDAETEAPILGPPDVKSWPIRKDPDTGKDWGQEENWMTEDEMVGWHHRLSEPEFEQTLEDGEGQGSLACCSPWGYKESDMTEQVNNILYFTDLKKSKKKTKLSACCCFFSVTQSCLILCNSMYCSTPGFSVLCYLLEISWTHI